jgi:hypothetical protein
MPLKDYFADVAEELKRKSDRVRFNFKTHRPSAGDNREAIVADFLGEHLPKAFGIGTGLILAQNDLFSKQADIVIVDQLSNSPLYSSLPEKIWLAESVYALIEVKTNLGPQDIADSLKECRRFKTLPRSFADVPAKPMITDSLFVVWAFDAPSPQTVKDNFKQAISGVPVDEQPDFVIVPDSLVVKSGSYHHLVELGMLGSRHRLELEKTPGGDLKGALGEGMDVCALGTNSLLAWIVWITSWLNAAGRRSAPLASYIPRNETLGHSV